MAEPPAGNHFWVRETTEPTMSNQLKTWVLLAALAGLFVVVGGLLGGRGGATIALVFALALNLFVYWNSDTLALQANGARELRPGELPELRRIVADVARQAGLPAPRVYLVDRPEPNAFATGRDPQHAAVAVTTGLLQILDERQLRGVLAHELSHVRNRDTLVGTVAASIAGAVSWLAQMAQFELFWGGWGGNDRRGANPLGLLATIILAPLAALLIQLAVSRSREYLADASGARLTGDPEGLASALEQLRLAMAQRGFLGRFGRAGQPAMNPAFAHLYFVNPLSGADLAALFSTHPPIEERILRLRAMTGGWHR